MQKKNVYTFILVLMLSLSVKAQEAIINLDEVADDDTLPISQTRYDDAVELPKNNFSSVGKQDMWEKFERGELDEKAFIKLQEQYQYAASQSKDPVVKRKIASDLRDKKAEDLKAKKEERATQIALDKKMKKKEEATRFDREIGLMAKEKENAQKKAEDEAKLAKAEQDKIDAKNKKLAAKANATKRAPASVKKTLKPKKKK